ncbi:MAG TPA: YHS domain-containing protein [Bryobacteraceae bacterium]|nr:YHS domain-containing protein [Bryobacteraceae bacterium]
MEETWGLHDYSDGTITASVDPVCGTVVDESKARGKFEYAGQFYYFCSKDCKRTFEEEPSRYIWRPHQAA